MAVIVHIQTERREVDQIVRSHIIFFENEQVSQSIDEALTASENRGGDGNQTSGKEDVADFVGVESLPRYSLTLSRAGSILRGFGRRRPTLSLRLKRRSTKLVADLMNTHRDTCSRMFEAARIYFLLLVLDALAFRATGRFLFLSGFLVCIDAVKGAFTKNTALEVSVDLCVPSNFRT
jgi:hypothetical protein